MRPNLLILPFVAALGCQGAIGSPEPEPETSTPSAYVEDVRKIKASHTTDLDGEITRAQDRHGMFSDSRALNESSYTNPKNTELVRQALVGSPSAFQELYSNATQPAAKGFRHTFSIKKPGNVVTISAEAFGNSDPMLFLIQFDDSEFKSHGSLSSASAQNRFRIVAMNDDFGSTLGSRITWQAGQDDTGHYMIVAAPYTDASRGRTIVRYTQTPEDGDCGTNWSDCDSYVTSDPQLEHLSGGIVRGFSGNRFEVLSATSVDPYLFVFNGTTGYGVANDDNNGHNSVVYLPEFSLPNPYTNKYDFALISGYSGNGTVHYRQGFQSEPEIRALRYSPDCIHYKPPVPVPRVSNSQPGSDSIIDLNRSGLTNPTVVPGYREAPSQFSFNKSNKNPLKYRVYLDGNSCPEMEIAQDQLDTLKFSIGDLETNKDHVVKVSGVFSDRESLPTTVATFRQRLEPTAPTNFQYIRMHRDGTVDLRWRDASGEASSYVIYFRNPVCPDSSRDPCRREFETVGRSAVGGVVDFSTSYAIGNNSTYELDVVGVFRGFESPSSNKIRVSNGTPPSTVPAPTVQKGTVNVTFKINLAGAQRPCVKARLTNTTTNASFDEDGVIQSGTAPTLYDCVYQHSFTGLDAGKHTFTGASGIFLGTGAIDVVVPATLGGQQLNLMAVPVQQ